VKGGFICCSGGLGGGYDVLPTSYFAGGESWGWLKTPQKSHWWIKEGLK